MYLENLACTNFQDAEIPGSILALIAWRLMAEFQTGSSDADYFTTELRALCDGKHEAGKRTPFGDMLKTYDLKGPAMVVFGELSLDADVGPLGFYSFFAMAKLCHQEHGKGYQNHSRAIALR